MKVVFRVDASLKIGSGHVMRCLALAQALKENNVSVKFICRKHEGNLLKSIRSSGFDVSELELSKDSEIDSKLRHSDLLGVTQNKDADECIDIIKSSNTNWLIVDHYALDEDWHLKLKPFCKKIMVIDDLADRKHQCDILLDQTFGRTQEDYLELVPKGCEILLGSQYALLRPEFSKWRKYSLERRRKPKFKKLFINMGGVDPDNFTGEVLKELKKCQLPKDIEITIVMGETSPHLGKVRNAASSLSCKVIIKTCVDNMAEIMANADLAIGSSGMSTWERCCLGLPTIQIIIAKNQLFSAKTLADHHVVKLLREIKEVNHLLKDPFEWMQVMSNMSAQLCYGIGVYKVFNKLTNYQIFLDKFGEIELYNFVNLDENDKDFVLSMRNHPQVNKWMHDQDDISKNSHLNFLESLQNDLDRRYFLVKQHKNIIGSINFSNIDLYSAELGLYTNPFLKLKDLGRILEASASYYAFIELGLSKLCLEVFSRNERAIKFYKRCGFKNVDTGKTNNHNLVYMEKIGVL